MIIPVAFHRIVPRDNMWDNPISLKMDIETFENHLKLISENYDVVKPDEFINSDNSEKVRLLLTFDDGAVDFYRYAAPILKSFGMPALVAICTGHAETGELFWWDKLYYLFRNNLKRPFLTPFNEFKYIFFADENDLKKKFPEIVGKLKYIEPAELEFWLSHELEKVTIDSDFIDKNRSMNWEEISDLCNYNIDVVPHGVNHNILTTLNNVEVSGEIINSIDKLRERDLFSNSFYVWPNGDVSDYGKREIAFLKSRNIKYGLAVTAPGKVNIQENNYNIGRLMVGNDKDYFQPEKLKDAYQESKVFDPLNLYNKASCLENTILKKFSARFFDILYHSGVTDKLRGGAAYHLGLMNLKKDETRLAGKWFKKTLEIIPQHKEASYFLRSRETGRKVTNQMNKFSRKNIVVISPFLCISGVTSVIKNVALGLADRFDFNFIALCSPIFHPVFREIGECFFEDDYCRILQHIERWNADLIFALHTGHLWMKLKYSGIPLVEWSVYGTEYPSGAGITINSKFRKESEVYVPDPVNINYCENIIPEVLWNEEDFVIGTATRISFIKNIPLLIRAVAKVQKKIKRDAKLLILASPYSVLSEGGDISFEEIENLCKKLLIKDSWKIVEALDTAPYIKRMNVAVITSFSEGLPVFLLEAALLKVPLVASDVGFIKDLIGENERGLLFPTEDLEKLVCCIDIIINNKENYADSAYSYVVANHLTVEKYGELFANKINKVVKIDD